MNNLIFPIEAESEDLKIHTELCAQRYSNLDQRLTNVESKVDSLTQKIEQQHSDIIRALIGTGGTIVVAIISAVGLVLNHFS
jgi:tetrahydromethanopterin S-methyltransferase subunit G